MNLNQGGDDAPWLRGLLIVGMILFAAMVRMVPHPWNFAPVGAMALFSGALVRNRVMAFLLPLLALAAGDAFIAFYKLIPVVYASFLISVAIGFWLRENRTVLRLGGAVFVGAVQFFVVTNFGVWAFMTGYPKTVAGLMACYAAGVPLFWNTLAGDAMYSALLFGALSLAERVFPVLRPSASAA
jgi:hypothetical protein